jgi:RNA polymerase sigma-70 factor (ECF subfamily)
VLFLKEMGGRVVYPVVDTTTMAEDERPPSTRPSRPGEEGIIPTRESLLSRLKDWGDDASWQEFFDTYWRLIYRMGRQAGLSDAEAQDIVQDTVLSVARRIEWFRYDPKVCSFKSWMLQITRWRILNQLKKRQREEAARAPIRDEVPSADALERVADPATMDLNAVWEQEWREHLLAAALERVKHRVDPAQFQIFDLAAVEQWPARRVAETLRVSVARVYLTKHRVGRLLKQEVKRLERRAGQERCFEPPATGR